MTFKDISHKRSKTLKITLFLVMIIIVFLEIRMKRWLYVILSIFVILALFLDKEKLISEKGFYIKYNVLGIKIESLWKWKEITNIIIDYKKKAPNIQVYIVKDLVIRPFLLNFSKGEELLKFIKKMNPKITIETKN